MSAPTLLPLQCLKCQTPLPAEVDEVAWVCPNCGQAILLDEKQSSELSLLEIYYGAGIQSGTRGRPFWVAQGKVAVRRETYSGNQNRQAQEFWQTPHTFFVPAYACSLDELISLGMQLLRQPVAMTQGGASPFLPVKLSPDDVHPMAEFIIMGVEAERRDKVKSVEIQLELAPPVLWIFP